MWLFEDRLHARRVISPQPVPRLAQASTLVPTKPSRKEAKKVQAKDA